MTGDYPHEDNSNCFNILFPVSGDSYGGAWCYDDSSGVLSIRDLAVVVVEVLADTQPAFSASVRWR